MQKLALWLKKTLKLSYQEGTTGGLSDKPDVRDFRHEEIVSDSVPITWTEKPQGTWRTFPIFNQDGSSSCVGQTIAKLLGIENVLEENKFVQFSARDIYSRGFQTAGGMFYRDGMDIGYKFGSTVEQLMPSQLLGEDVMRNANDRTTLTSEIALVGKGGSYFALPIDIDAIAQVIAQGKGVALGVKFNAGQWMDGEVKTDTNGTLGHAVTITDFTLYKGQKALVFDNSWGTAWGFNGQGVLTADQLGGVNAAWYYASLPNNWRDTQTGGVKPQYQFLNNLGVGMRNTDVQKLQECLKYDGEFPSAIVPTGYFGGITLGAVKSFQTKYAIPVTGVVDNSTREKLNSLFQ